MKGLVAKSVPNLEAKPKPVEKTKDLVVNILVRSSVEEIQTLNHLCDMIITCVLSEFELVLVEKESKVLLTYQKNLRSVRLILQDPDQPE